MKEILLSNNSLTFVDDDDYEQLRHHKWGIVGNKQHRYAARGVRKNKIYSKILMHRVIMNGENTVFVDHINGNTMDNRKVNLRIASRAQNLQNSKLRSDSNCKFKGVSKKISRLGTVRFTARIQISIATRLYLGWFRTEVEAALAYNEAALQYFGEFAKLNQIT